MRREGRVPDVRVTGAPHEWLMPRRPARQGRRTHERGDQDTQAEEESPDVSVLWRRRRKGPEREVRRREGGDGDERDIESI